MIRKAVKSHAHLKRTKVPNIQPPEWSTRKKRMQYARDVVNSGLSQEERLQQANQITRRVRHDVQRWTTSLDRAAYYMAEDRMSLRQISEKTGIAVSQLKRFIRLDGEFMMRVKHYSDIWAKRVMEQGIASRVTRCNVLQELHEKMRDIIYQRAEKYKNKKQPGVNTGLMIRTVKAVGHGAKTKIVRGWDFDKDLTKEMREIQMQIAKDLGQWTEKVDNQNLVLVREYKGVNPADI